ncbi:hypothetical protein [Chitinophaga filiformis]|uniref:TolB-like 6-blade propeller-like n=1 Tax=Chitinophaga filiformis TaxID=104663 RepID=A0ABY4HW96_CHIFI|nr:hypothetical protein [Chitinophaga filiformis]UPK68061.1 hypothetical protein MYF79_24215 [Chitinophaga filiformis]
MKTGKNIFGCFIAGILIIVFLQQYARQKEGFPNGFNRTIIQGILEPPVLTGLKINSYYIIGFSNDRIYLGNHARSRQILELPYDLGHVDTSWLNIKDSVLFGWGAATIHKQGNSFYLAEGVTPCIIGFPKTDTIGTVLETGTNHFDLILPSERSFVFRTYDTSVHRNVLAYAQYGKRSLTIPALLKDQQDGVFSTDGMLLYDSLSARFLYIYYYRNQLMSFDNNLKNVIHGNTIDTVTRAKIQIHEIRSEHSITFSAPPLKVNKLGCTFHGLLFIYSGLRADNEMGKIAHKSSPIDVYKINDFKYLGSFYIPNYDGKGIRDMAIYNDKLVALRESEITIYNLHLSSFITKK